jgi:AcrR family transcriptional regulator
MDAAMQVFAAKGYAATTVDDIARAAGASAATFYLHFRRKVDVLVASVESQTLGVYAEAGSLWPTERPHSREALRAWVERLFARWRELTTPQRIIGQAELVEPELRSLRTARFVEGVAYWENFLRDAGAPGGRARRADASLLNSVFVGLFEMWIVSDVAVDEGELVELVADELWRRVERHRTPPVRRPRR